MMICFLKYELNVFLQLILNPWIYFLNVVFIRIDESRQDVPFSHHRPIILMLGWFFFLGGFELAIIQPRIMIAV